MAEMKLIGAVGIKVRPVARDFKRELNQQINNLPEKTVEVKVDADTRNAERKIKNVKDEAERDKINLRVGVDYDGLRDAQQKIRQSLKRVADEPFSLKMDTKSLKDGLKDIEDRLGKAEIKMHVANDEAGFRAVLAKIEQIKRAKTEVVVPFKADTRGLERAEKKARRELEKAVINKGVKIRYVEDREGLAAAIAKIDDAVRNLRTVEINPRLTKTALLAEKRKLQRELNAIPLELKYNEDRDGLQQAIAQLEKLKRDAAQVTLEYKNNARGLDKALKELRQKLEIEPVKVNVVPDQKGYEEVLAHVEELQRQAKAIEFKYRTDEQGLKDAAEILRKNIADLRVSPTIDFKYKDDTNGIKGALSEVEDQLKKIGLITLKANLDEEGLREAKAELERKLADSSFDIKVNTKDLASLRRERERLAELYREQSGQQVELSVDMSEESIRHAAHKIDKLIHDAEKDPIKLDVEPVGLALAAAQIGWASRSRVVPFFIRIDNKSRLIAEGVIKSLAGYNTLSSIGTGIENLVTNFDNAIIKGGAIATVLGGIVDSLAYGVTNALAMAAGIVEVVGLLATAPAALSAAAAILLVNVAAFKDFKAAIDGADGALEKLPANAQAAAVALRGTWESIQQPIQDAYWESMGTSLQDMVTVLLPKVRDGLALTGTHIGTFAKNTADTLRELGEGDIFDTMFANLGGFFDEASGIAEPLTRAINTLGLRGSEYLPQFGKWLSDITVQFNDWIQAADEAGDINRWIEDGVKSLQDMWRVGAGVTDIIIGLTTASMNAGGTGLSDAADEMQRWGDIARGEPFQTRLTQIFAGARVGASNLNVGFKNLASSLGENSSWLGDVLNKLGLLGGITLTNLSTIFRSGQFRGGIYEALLGLTDLVTNLRPSFENLGAVVGTLGRTAAEAFRGLAPLINNVTGGLRTVTDILGDELPGLARVLTGQLTNTFGAVAIVAEQVARVVEPLLQLFLDMPGSIQTIILAAAGFQIMRGQISKMLTVLSERGHFNAFRGSWSEARRHVGNEANRMAVANRLVATSMGTLASGTRTGFSTMISSLSNYRTAISSAQGPLATSGAAIMGPLRVGANLGKLALSGLSAVMGGPLGIALAVGGIALSLYASHQQKVKAEADALRESLDQQTGAITDNTKKVVAQQWMQDGTGIWQNFWRGAINGSEAAHETVAKLGESSANVTKWIAEGGQGYDDWLTKLNLIRDNLSIAKAQESGQLKGAGLSMEELSDKTGVTIEVLRTLNAATLDNLIGETEDGRESVQKAADETKRLAEALGVSEGAAEKVSKVIKTLGEDSSTTAERVSALKEALDLMSGGVLSKDDAARNFARTWTSAIDDLIAANDNGVGVIRGNFNDLVNDVDGSISDLGGKGGILYDAAKQVTNGLLEQSAAAFKFVIDNKGSIEEASAAAAEALTLSKFQIQEFASAMGVEVPKAEAVLNRFLQNPWAAVALQVDSKFFYETMEKVEGAGREFNEAEWIAALKLRDLTALGFDEASAKGENWEAQDYIAALKAAPEAALATLAETLGITDDKWKHGDFSAILKAFDGTGPGVAQALLELALVEDGDYTAVLEALLDEISKAQAAAELEETANPGGGVRPANIKAVPHTGEATLALNVTANPRDADITGRPHTEDANQQLNNTANPRDARITGRPETTTAEDRLNNTGRNRDALYRGYHDLDKALYWLNDAARNRSALIIAQANTYQASIDLNALSAQRTVYYKAKVEGPGTTALNGAIINGAGVQTFANGGMFTPKAKRYASGGYENHIAEISRGQTPYRIWSEPETGGEAYIPLSPSKRNRSTQILEQVATQFGMKLTDSRAVKFANGGIIDGGRTGQGVSVNIGSYVTSQTDTPDDVARALMRRIKVQGANSPLEAF